jgi:RNA polymerase sigma-70 factor (ECF subfamily)
MLGSVMDAEDMVQETYLRWQSAAPADVRSPKAYLSTVITRLCIDRLRSARARRESYIGPWLPEPLVTEENDIDDRTGDDASLSMAFLVLLERLTPVERAVFLLRDVFDYDYAEVARATGKSEANCRQLARRARGRVAEQRRRFEAPPAQVEAIAARFLRAAADGDMQGLLDLLAEDVTLWSDGGGKVAAALNPVAGADKVARFFAGLGQKLPADFSLRRARVNGGPGIIMYQGARPYGVVSAEIAGGRVRGLRIVVNPEKLQRVPLLA